MIQDKRHQTVGNTSVVRFRSDPEPDTPAQDVSGYVVFSEGEAGAAHLAAHRMLDAGQVEFGHQKLKKYLNGRTGLGSEWIHLQFHMAIFELALGDWHSAHARFFDEILPAAASTQDALTDAPALLWRLSLSAPEPVVLPWQPLRQTALDRMQRPSDPSVELHNLLALAGADDVTNIAQWLNKRSADSQSESERLVEQIAVALLAYANHAYREAATLLRSVVPQLPQVGGSRAQNELFDQLEAASWQQVNGLDFPPVYSAAA